MKNLEQAPGFSRREELLQLAAQRYGAAPESLWQKYPEYQVLRHEGSKKWYALFMRVPLARLGLPGEGAVDVVNLKCDPLMSGSLRLQPGFLPAYHMNRANWLTALLDGIVDSETLASLLDMSFALTGPKAKAARPRKPGPALWVVPANPKYYDVDAAFARQDIICWKQSSHIQVGDIVYLYVGAPWSAIRYKCRAVQVDIPTDYEDTNVRMRRMMRIQRLRTYDKEPLSFALLNRHGVYAVRGPRGIPDSLVREIDRLYPEPEPPKTVE